MSMSYTFGRPDDEGQTRVSPRGAAKPTPESDEVVDRPLLRVRLAPDAGRCRLVFLVGNAREFIVPL